MPGGPNSTNMMDTGGNQVMDTSNSVMHAEPVAYEVNNCFSEKYSFRY